MTPPHDQLQAALKRFGLCDPVRIAETGAAQVFRVTRRSGDPAALKLFTRGDMGNETGAVAFLKAWDGKRAVRVLDHSSDALVMEWAEGPLLGDMARQVQNAAADETLAQVATRLHRTWVTLPDAPRLDTWIAPLFDLRFASDCDRPLRRDMERAAAMARSLLPPSEDWRILHGDLHHDNVIVTSDGPVAIDQKGILGDPAFELANAFRHPRGSQVPLADGGLIAKRVELWSAALDVPARRLLQWAAVKCALSIAWRAKGSLDRDPEGPLLSALISTTHPS